MSAESVVALLLGGMGTLATVVGLLFRMLNEAHARNYARMEVQYEQRLTEYRQRVAWLESQLGRGVGVAEALASKERG